MFISSIRIAAKFTLFIAVVSIYLLVGEVARFFIRDSKKKRLFSVHLVSLFSRILLGIFRFTVKSDEIPAHLKKEGPYLLVANHLSYTDILVVSKLLPCVFITSKEVEETPFLGWLSRIGGSYFVERRRKFQLPREIEDVSQILREGFRVVLFPEATSTNGEAVIPFKKPFFKAATDQGVPVAPFCIQYETVNGGPITTQNRDALFYYDNMTFFPHIFNLLAQKSVHIRVKFLDPLSTEKEKNRRVVGNTAHGIISEVYSPVIPVEMGGNATPPSGMTIV